MQARACSFCVACHSRGPHALCPLPASPVAVVAPANHCALGKMLVEVHVGKCPQPPTLLKKNPPPHKSRARAPPPRRFMGKKGGY